MDQLNENLADFQIFSCISEVFLQYYVLWILLISIFFSFCLLQKEKESLHEELHELKKENKFLKEKNALVNKKKEHYECEIKRLNKVLAGTSWGDGRGGPCIKSTFLPESHKKILAAVLFPVLGACTELLCNFLSHSCLHLSAILD